MLFTAASTSKAAAVSSIRRTAVCLSSTSRTEALLRCVPQFPSTNTTNFASSALPKRTFRTSSVPSASYRRFGNSQASEQPGKQKQTDGYVGQQVSPEEMRKQLEERLFRPIGSRFPIESRNDGTKAAPSTYQRFGGAVSGGGRGGSKGGGWKTRFGSRPPTLILVAIGAAGIYYVVHLEKVPETGRWRFIDVSPAQERELGEQTFRQTLQEYRGKILPANHPYSRQVRSVASRIVAALDRTIESQPHHHTKGDASLDHGSHGEEGGIRYGSTSSLNQAAPKQGGSESLPPTQWEVFVIDDPAQKNAFVLPGGKIFVFTGILPICANNDGLATVLGHEVAHQVARHSAEKMSGYKVLLFGAFMLELSGLDIGLSRTALTLLLSLPNSRKTELEADYLGLKIMSRACFNPEEATKLWTRMSKSEGGDGESGGGILSSAQAVLSTHPVSSQRIKNMQKWLPEAMSTREQSNCPSPQQITGFRNATSNFTSAFS